MGGLRLRVALRLRLLNLLLLALLGKRRLLLIVRRHVGVKRRQPLLIRCLLIA
jgi:hypothetical protein